jgi:anti-anti-sigma factor
MFTKGKIMQLEKSEKKGYQIIRIQDDLNFNSDLTEVKKVVEDFLAQNKILIAVSLTPRSYLSSMSIGYLLSIYKKVKEKNGILAVIQPNEEDNDLLEMLSMTSVIETYRSEDELVSKK